VNPLDDGNKGLEKTLTDLMKAMTGLVGKSIYLILKMKNGGSFLGDWFGEQDQEIVVQVIFGTREVLYLTQVCRWQPKFGRWKMMATNVKPRVTEVKVRTLANSATIDQHRLTTRGISSTRCQLDHCLGIGYIISQ
jgi:hypothetical protein